MFSGSYSIFSKERQYKDKNSKVCEFSGWKSKLYCFGGKSNEDKILNSVEVHELGGGFNFNAEGMRERRYGLVGVAIGNHVYAVGKQFSWFEKFAAMFLILITSNYKFLAYAAELSIF